MHGVPIINFNFDFTFLQKNKINHAKKCAPPIVISSMAKRVATEQLTAASWDRDEFEEVRITWFVNVIIHYVFTGGFSRLVFESYFRAAERETVCETL